MNVAVSAFEFVTSRTNHAVDPSLDVWGWEIAVYLFLGGFVAGLLFLCGFALARGRAPLLGRGSIAGLGLASLSAGMVALFLDLEYKAHVFRLYATLEPTAPMSWGAWILVFVYPVLAALWVLEYTAVEPTHESRWSVYIRRTADWMRPARRRALGAVAVLLGIALGVYTGLLLGSLGARPLWSSAMLGPLFLVSGLSSGAAYLHLVARDPEVRTAVERWDNALIVAELVSLLLLFLGLHTASATHREAAALFFGGPYTALFWVIVVGLGLVAPLTLQVLVSRGRMRHTAWAPILVLAGCLALRFILVHAGQASHWPQV